MSAWHMFRLGECAEIVSGATPSTSEPSYWGGDISWATPKDLSELDGIYIADTPRKITDRGLQSCASAVLPPESVLFSSRAPIGHVAINTTPMATNQGFKSFIPNRDRLDAKYLYYWLRANRQYLEGLGNGATFKEVSKAVVSRIEIPLPPTPEQRRIAAILDKADALRTKRRAALKKLDELTQSIFLDMFGDPRRNEKGWAASKIGSITSEVRGGAALKPEDFVETGCPILHKGAIKPGGRVVIDSKKKTFATWAYANAHKKHFVDRSCIAVTLRDLVPAGPNIGLATDLRKGPFDKYLLAQGAYGLELKHDAIIAEYFVQLSNMPNFRHVLRQNAVGSTQIHIRTPIYLAIRIPVPPIELQRDFAHCVQAIEELETVQSKSAARLDALFASLQHRAFRGEL